MFTIKKYAWYSKNSEKDGNTIYIYLDKGRNQIKCTAITNDINDIPYPIESNYNDYKYIGEVKEFIKNDSNQLTLFNKLKSFIKNKITN